jgi:ornithine cyclodeaminase
MRLLSAQDIQHALPMPAAIEVMAQAFRDIASRRASLAERQVLALPAGTSLLMGAALPGTGLLAKLVSVLPGNPARGLPATLGTTLLADEQTGLPLALLDGTALTAWRTAALSACAITVLARPDARRALLLGCGSQAASQVQGLDALPQITDIHLFAPRPEQVAAFIRVHQPGLRVSLHAVTDLEPALAAADVIVTATSSSTPVFAWQQLAPGTHVNAIGGFRAGMCEIDPALCQQSAVFVESRATARLEAGELIEAVRQGWSDESTWTELGDVLEQRHPGRSGDDQLTLFKSVGHALFDLHAARQVYDRVST